MEERQAIARLQSGDWSGLETLVERYQVKAVQAAGLIVQDRALAEDIVQSAFVVAAQRIEQYDPERPFGPWFYRSVVNAAIKAANRQKRQIPLEQPLPGQDFSLEDILADEGLQPEEWLEREENRAFLLAAIDGLPAEQRAVIVMRYFLEMSETDMAGEMKRPQSTIKYWLRAARKKLRKALSWGPENRSNDRDRTRFSAEPSKNEAWHE